MNIVSISNDVFGRTLKPIIKNVGEILVLAYFFVGFLQNFPELLIYSQIIGILLILAIFITKSNGPHCFSPLIVMYGLFTLISTLSCLIYGGEFSKSMLTMPYIFMAMIACRKYAKSGIFQNSILANTLPFIVLISYGMNFDVSSGRYYSYFLNEAILGSLLPFSFAAGALLLWNWQFNWRAIILILPPTIFMYASSRRGMLIYFVCCMSALCLIKLYEFKLERKNIFSLIIAGIFSIVMFNHMVGNQSQRFEEKFNLLEHSEKVVKGTAKDVSSVERSTFNRIATAVAQVHIIGVGNGNFQNEYKKAISDGRNISNPHSGFSESLVIGGYPGLFLYLIMLVYLLWLGRKSPIMLLCMIWMFLSIFIETSIANRLIWPLMAIAERELYFGMNDNAKFLLKLPWQR